MIDYMKLDVYNSDKIPCAETIGELKEILNHYDDNLPIELVMNANLKYEIYGAYTDGDKLTIALY